MFGLSLGRMGNLGWRGKFASSSLNLNFVSSSQVLDPRITFTRASNATRVNSSGLIETVANNAPRFDYDPVTLAPKGLLIEEQRTNLLTYSEQFDNAAWTKSNASITANAITAPDGALTADKLVEGINNSEHYVQQLYTLGANAAHSFSAFVKAAGRTVVRLFAVGDRFGGIAQAFVFDLSAITATNNNGTSTGSIVSVGNGWFRCTMNMPTTTSTGNFTLRVLPQSGSNSTYTGDGTSGIYVWGAQLEAGAFPTSYIPTTTAAATRAADVAVMTGTNFSSWYNQTEGTLFVEVDTLETGTVSGGAFVLNFSDGTGNNLHRIFRQADAQPVMQTLVGGTPQSTFGFGANWTDTNVRRLAYAYAANNFAGVVNAGAVQTDTSGTIPAVNMLDIGVVGTSTQLNGHIRHIAYYPRRLSNSELQAITA